MEVYKLFIYNTHIYIFPARELLYIKYYIEMNNSVKT